MTKIPKSHPRYTSLKTRELIVNGVNKGITSIDGLIAHGRGEAFDYLIGEKTSKLARKSIESAAALLLLAENPVISVNGNTAALVPKELVKLSKIIKAPLEVNIFHSSKKRELKIKAHLKKYVPKNVLKTQSFEQSSKPSWRGFQSPLGEVLSKAQSPLGEVLNKVQSPLGEVLNKVQSPLGEVLLPNKKYKIRFLESNRKYANPNGILKADVVFAPLEDGDRAEALIKNGKKVITIDLNPLSRTAQKATITIVDNIVRAMPLLIKAVKECGKYDKNKLKEILKNFKDAKKAKGGRRDMRAEQS